MRSRCLTFVCLGLTLAIGGCTQSDGALPTPEGDDPGRLVDLQNNLDNISRGDPQAAKDLADDLTVFVPGKPDAGTAVSELATRTAAALAGRSLSEGATEEFARQLWVAVRGRELSEKQIAALQTEVQTSLTAAGVPSERAEPVAAQIGEVQRVVTDRPRRWYQWF